ncbi:MAG: hypothetical protein DMF84_11070 [Acidobacteria bacterium]|nr:MAG: hypothetical protein DMF84_11070 [Acidobacteriota bacterium]
MRPAPGLKRRATSERVERLRASLALRGGSLVERERWLIDQRRWAEAVDAFGQLIAEFPDSRATQEGRFLSHRARLGMALDLANAERDNRDIGAASAQLEALAGEPYDEAICAAKIARATLLATDRRAEADTMMREAGTSVDATESFHRAPDRQPVSKPTSWPFANPRITQIEFVDAGRTKPAVAVTVGYSGATVVLEKENGSWRTKALVNRWVT